MWSEGFDLDVGVLFPVIKLCGQFLGDLIQGLVLRWSIYEFSFSLEEEADSVWMFLWSALAPRGTELDRI